LLIRHNHSQLITFIAISIAVLITRLPFLQPGYGLDPDAWGVAYIAQQIFRTHQYAVSRFPGYPLQELSYALIWRGGAPLMNGITALFSGFAAGFLALSGNKLGYRAPILGAMIFAFTPVIYINSVNSMDYIWAIAFILGSLYFALSDRISLAGLFLGLAIGTRLTSIVFSLPLILVLAHRNAPGRDKLKLSVITGVVGILFYIPVVLTYGTGFLRHHVGGRIPVERIVFNATAGVWGWFGLGGVILAVGLLLWEYLRTGSLTRMPGKASYWKIWAGTILLFLVLYLYLPHEAAYLIPVVPFTILLFQEFLTKKMLFLLLLAVICSSLLLEIYPKSLVSAAGFDQRYRTQAVNVRLFGHRYFITPIYGLMQYDHSFRTAEINRFTKVFEFGNHMQEKSVILVGWNLSKFANLAMNTNQEFVIYRDFLDEGSIHGYLENGYRIYYLPEILPASIELYNVDYSELDSIPIKIY
jgi:hypothetical protein